MANSQEYGINGSRNSAASIQRHVEQWLVHVGGSVLARRFCSPLSEPSVCLGDWGRTPDDLPASAGENQTNLAALNGTAEEALCLMMSLGVDVGRHDQASNSLQGKARAPVPDGEHQRRKSELAATIFSSGERQ